MIIFSGFVLGFFFFWYKLLLIFVISIKLGSAENENFFKLKNW